MHGYTFGKKIDKKLLQKVKFGAKTLACKIVKKKKSEDVECLEILKTISHPGIVPIHSILQNEKFAFIFTQWSDEGDLMSFIRENGAVSEWRANFWFYQMVCAVKYLHAMNLAHCNFRCESVMISDVKAKLSSLSHIQRSPHDPKTSQRVTKLTPPFYLPPDANKGLLCDTKKLDVFALGVILFMMLNASVPFPGENIAQLADDQINRRFSIRASLINSLSVDCQSMIHTLLEPRENLRWSIDKVFRMKWLSKFIDMQGDF